MCNRKIYFLNRFASDCCCFVCAFDRQQAGGQNEQIFNNFSRKKNAIKNTKLAINYLHSTKPYKETQNYVE